MPASSSRVSVEAQTMQTIEGYFLLALYISHPPANSRVLIEKTSASYASSAFSVRKDAREFEH